MKIAFFGDIVGPRGIEIACRHIKSINEKENPDVVIVNIENSAPKGKGFTEEGVKKLISSGCDVFTGGNHSFAKKDSLGLYSQYKNLLRPSNFPSGVPGVGHYIFTTKNEKKVLIINIQLRVFMREQIGCPFKCTEEIIKNSKDRDGEDIIIFIDLHGETTSEKISFGLYFDGMVSAVVGTHTHVQTADERILPKGTAFITDVGMTGAINSSLGVKASATIYNFIYQMPSLFELDEEGDFVSNGVLIGVDDGSKKANYIKRLAELYKS